VAVYRTFPFPPSHFRLTEPVLDTVAPNLTPSVGLLSSHCLLAAYKNRRVIPPTSWQCVSNHPTFTDFSLSPDPPLTPRGDRIRDKHGRRLVDRAAAFSLQSFNGHFSNPLPSHLRLIRWHQKDEVLFGVVLRGMCISSVVIRILILWNRQSIYPPS